MDIMFRTVYTLLADRVRRLDFIIASGTHPPLSEEAINQRVGITPEERKRRYTRVRFFNHYWQKADQLKHVGTINADEIHQISGGLLNEKVDISVNKMVFEYDLLMIIGPTFPHEVVGFSGGNKYLFPGIAGQDIIDMFHWLGALITNPRIIGHADTPVRNLVDRAASLLPVEKLCLSLVVKEQGLAGLFIGTPEEAWRAAADLSRQVHIIYKDHPFKKVLSCAPLMYKDLWTGGKCMYKLEPVVADEGELIIYAPHIKEVSVTHGTILKSIGYHVRDYFVKQKDKFLKIPGGVMAHSTHVKGIGTYENGIEQPRIKVTLATGIPEKVCAKINLGYLDPELIHPEEWQNREEDGILYVPKAGEILFRLKNDPFTD
jgi:nickel-dependent lactate racemase